MQLVPVPASNALVFSQGKTDLQQLLTRSHISVFPVSHPKVFPKHICP